MRPVSLAWDSKGRLWFSSDATGEIFVMYNAAFNSSESSGSGNSTSSGGSDDSGSAGFQNMPPSYFWTMGVGMLAIGAGFLLA